MSALAPLPWWAWALMAVGVLAIGTLFVNLFSGVGERPRRARQAGDCPVGSVDFLLALAGVTNAPLHRGGTARLLNNGDAFVPAMLEAIRGAERSVNYATYMWRDGHFSDLMFEAFMDARRRGVEVRVLVDWLGGIRAPRRRIREFRRAGGTWRTFHSARFGVLTKLHKRMHRRALVIDGMVGFTGGASVMDKWLGDARGPNEWRDCMIEVRGRLALSLQSAFTQLWSHATGELITGPEFYPPHAHEAEEGSRGEPITRHINFVGSPSSESHPMRGVFWLTIRCARKRVWITSPYFVPDRLLVDALKERAAKGVEIRILLPNEHNDVPVIRWASRSYYDELLEAGVRIHEFQPTMIHQKLLVADGVWSLVGSANFDVRSKELNQENLIGLLDREFAAQLEATFLADLDRAHEIHLDSWRRRPRPPRIVERFLRLFEEQF